MSVWNTYQALKWKKNNNSKPLHLVYAIILSSSPYTSSSDEANSESSCDASFINSISFFPDIVEIDSFHALV